MIRTLFERWKTIGAAWRGSDSWLHRGQAQRQSEVRPEGTERTNSEARTAAVVDALPDAALLLNDDLVLLHGNGRAADVLGKLTTGAHIARTSRHPEMTQALLRVQSGERAAGFGMQLRGAIERHLQGSVTRLALAQGGHGAAGPTILVVLQDLSERDALARTRMEFVANASHELRTPLASLVGYIETLRGPAKDDAKARERFLGIMADQAARMTRLIDDLLLLSRVEMRVHVMPTATVDLNAVVTEAVKPLTTMSGMPNARVDVHTQAGPMLVKGDHDELVQAVQNLVQNAVKYGKPGGLVTVRLSTADRNDGQPRWSKVSVTDDGPGIAPEHLPRLTERFYRVSTAASRQKGGTGLGLAIVKHIVSRHQGRLDIASSIGQGSTFSILLPATG